MCDPGLGFRRRRKHGALVGGYRARPVSANSTPDSKHDATLSNSGNGWASCDWNSCRWRSVRTGDGWSADTWNASQSVKWWIAFAFRDAAKKRVVRRSLGDAAPREDSRQGGCDECRVSLAQDATRVVRAAANVRTRRLFSTASSKIRSRESARRRGVQSQIRQSQKRSWCRACWLPA